MNNDEVLEGGCACGAVRYRMEAAPLVVHCCHCTWCQRETGASFALNALLEADRLTVLAGKPEPVATPSASGRGQAIFRCPECRVAVWSHYAGAGDKIDFVRAGTLDEAHRLQPDVHIFTSTKQPWVAIPEGVPVYDEYYRTADVWSAGSIARWERLQT